MSTLCRMTLLTQYEDFGDGVVAFAKHSILDAVGVIIGGSAMEGIPEIVELVKDKGGKPESYLPFYGGKVPASEAGLAIGPMGRAMDFGQIHEEAGHNSEYIVAGLMAALGLKEKVTGKEFLTSFVLGQEVLIRVNMAWRSLSRAIPRGRSSAGAIFGVTAGIGRLLGLSGDELGNAQGIARGMTQPHDLAMTGTLMVRVHHGFICQDAINACLFARRGITGPRNEVLLGRCGYLEMAKWETDPGALTDGLGDRWEMTNVMMKPYASCKCTHTSVGGLLDQMKKYRFTPEDIAEIHIDEASNNWSLVCVPQASKWNPMTEPECQFSMPYTVASAAYDGRLFLDAYEPVALGRPEVRSLMKRITAAEDMSLPPWAARVRTRLNNGSVYEELYYYVKGHPKNPFSEEEMIERFKTCVPYSAFPLSTTVVDSVIDAILHMEDLGDVEQSLILPLTPPG
jgi:2-methylcitrate dehydratase PrpD